jgi:hypothetical protein
MPLETLSSTALDLLTIAEFGVLMARTELANAKGRWFLQIELSVSGKTLTDNSSGS